MAGDGFLLSICAKLNDGISINGSAKMPPLRQGVL